MKKLIWVFFTIVIFLGLSLNYALAASDLCNSGGTGLVPCGQSNPDGSVPCKCEIGHFFVMLAKIYDFIVKMIATPLAIIAITIGAIFMMISAGNPNLFGTGKKIVYSAIIGLVLVFGSWVIINTILCTILGYCSWSTL